MWEDVAGRLASSCHCLAPDLPGFGRSEVPREYTRSLDGLARFVEALRVAANLRPPIDFVAHDFGGPFAFAWAVRNPSAVRRMVAINTLFSSDYRWHFWARVWRTPIVGEISMALMNRLIFAGELRRGAGRPLGREHIERTWALMTGRMKAEVLRLYRATDPQGFVGWEDQLRALIAERSAMVIWGDRDPYIPSRYAERFGATKVVHLPEVGHWPPVEAPEETARLILGFLAD
jgi:haloalkane dehalogenase